MLKTIRVLSEGEEKEDAEDVITESQFIEIETDAEEESISENATEYYCS